MATFPTPPTYANPIEEDQSTKKPVFNPIWLRWFLDAARFFEDLGTGGSGIAHNGLGLLQGGSPTERYHLELAEHAAVSGARILKGTDTTDDLIVDDDAKGLVLKDNAGPPHYWRITVDSAGVLSTTDLGTTKP